MSDKKPVPVKSALIIAALALYAIIATPAAIQTWRVELAAWGFEERIAEQQAAIKQVSEDNKKLASNVDCADKVNIVFCNATNPH